MFLKLLYFLFAENFLPNTSAISILLFTLKKAQHKFLLPNPEVKKLNWKLDALSSIRQCNVYLSLRASSKTVNESGVFCCTNVYDRNS